MTNIMSYSTVTYISLLVMFLLVFVSTTTNKISLTSTIATDNDYEGSKSNKDNSNNNGSIQSSNYFGSVNALYVRPPNQQQQQQQQHHRFNKMNHHFAFQDQRLSLLSNQKKQQHNLINHPRQQQQKEQYYQQQRQLCTMSSSSTTTSETGDNENSNNNINSNIDIADYETNNNNDDTIKIIIAGAPASGKGTQCEYIKNSWGVVHLSTGDMLREAVAANTPVGIIAKQYMDSGKLVPDDVIIDIVKARLREKDCMECGWLLDGFPRTQAQALALADAGVTADVFIFLNVPDNILVERVIGRRTDPVTGKIYHMKFSPPPSENDGIDEYGSTIASRLVQRSDDTEGKITVRLQQFKENVNAVLDNYSNITVSIDGNQSPNIVSELIMDAIQQRIGTKKNKRTMQMNA